MADNSWFEGANSPGAGDLGQIQALQQNLASVADSAGSARTRLNGLKGQVSDAVWRGPAADSFKSKIDTGFLGHLGKLHDSYQEAADGFTAYITAVSDIQGRAQNLAARIQSAQAQYESAVSALQGWVNQNPTTAWYVSGSLTAQAFGEGSPYIAAYRPAPVPVTPPGAAPAPASAGPAPADLASAFTSQQNQVDTAWNSMQSLYRQMDSLRTNDRNHADNAVIGKLKTAHDVGMHNESWWHSFFHIISEVCKWVVIALAVIAIVALIVLIPGLGVALAFAEVATLGGTLGSIVLLGGALASGIKLAADIGQDSTGGGASGATLAGDAFGMLPGLGTAGGLVSRLGEPAAALVDTLGGAAQSTKLFTVTKVLNFFTRLEGPTLGTAVAAERYLNFSPAWMLNLPGKGGDFVGMPILGLGLNWAPDTVGSQVFWGGLKAKTLWGGASSVLPPPRASQPGGITDAQAADQIRQFQQASPAQAALASQIAAKLALGGSAQVSFPPQHTYPQAVPVH